MTRRSSSSDSTAIVRTVTGDRGSYTERPGSARQRLRRSRLDTGTQYRESSIALGLPPASGEPARPNGGGFMKRLLASASLLAVLAAAVLVAAFAGHATAAAVPVPHPTFSDQQQMTTSETPPSELQCESVGRTCFTPQAIQSAYNLGPLYGAGLDGHGTTIAIVDSYGSDTMAHDLHVFDTQFGIAPMCGEEGVTCTAGM